MDDRALWAFVPCGLCGGTGESDYGLDECDECAGTGDQYVDPTTADHVADLVALPPAERVARLVALLRACPDEAVEAVDTAKVARAWDDGMRESLSRPAYASRARPPGEVAYNGRSGGWYVDRPAPAVHQEYDGGSAAEAAADAALLVDGWVLAGHVVLLDLVDGQLRERAP